MNTEQTLYSQNDFRNYSELYHHGVLGQKWGVRRYQNSDGTLTDEGAKRYSKLTNKKTKIEQKLQKSDERLNKLESKIDKRNIKLANARVKLNKAEKKRDKAQEKADNTQPYYDKKYALQDKANKYNDKAEQQKNIIKKYDDPKLDKAYQKEKLKNLNLSVKLSKIDSKIEQLGSSAISNILESERKQQFKDKTGALDEAREKGQIGKATVMKDPVSTIAKSMAKKQISKLEKATGLQEGDFAKLLDEAEKDRQSYAKDLYKRAGVKYR